MAPSSAILSVLNRHGETAPACALSERVLDCNDPTLGSIYTERGVGFTRLTWGKVIVDQTGDQNQNVDPLTD